MGVAEKHIACRSSDENYGRSGEKGSSGLAIGGVEESIGDQTVGSPMCDAVCDIGRGL